jgi:hypothetical protein
MLAARLAGMPVEEHWPLLERAALSSGAELVLASEDGAIAVDATRGTAAPERIRRLIAAGRGETVTELGRTHFYARRMPRPFHAYWVIAFVGAPEAPFATSSLIRSVAALTALLVGAAALVAFALARDVYADVRFVRERIVGWRGERTSPPVNPFPCVRSTRWACSRARSTCSWTASWRPSSLTGKIFPERSPTIASAARFSRL